MNNRQAMRGMRRCLWGRKAWRERDTARVNFLSQGEKKWLSRNAKLTDMEGGNQAQRETEETLIGWKDLKSVKDCQLIFRAVLQVKSKKQRVLQRSVFGIVLQVQCGKFWVPTLSFMLNSIWTWNFLDMTCGTSPKWTFVGARNFLDWTRKMPSDLKPRWMILWTGQGGKGLRYVWIRADVKEEGTTELQN